MNYITYCLYSLESDKIYIGYTSNLIERFKSHNILSTKGYTVNFRPWMVAYVEFSNIKMEAQKREKQLKSSRGRDFLRNYIRENYE
ncbi:MAG: putative endonuclease [Lentimonas sp.]|jgi:putative endonuclease